MSEKLDAFYCFLVVVVAATCITRTVPGLRITEIVVDAQTRDIGSDQRTG